jgi:hypothetical protein
MSPTEPADASATDTYRLAASGKERTDAAAYEGVPPRADGALGNDVADRLREISGVVLAEDVSGPYDALALISCADESDGLPRILDAVRDVPGVLRVLAAPLLASEDPGARVDAA